MALPIVAFREEPADLVPLWHRFARRQTASPKLWMHAYLAAFAITAQLSIVTFDGDFKQFEHAGLKLQLLKAP